ncbi:hypothetical protein ACIREE_41345 [Streptomyces sp. NPDC102467]
MNDTFLRARQMRVQARGHREAARQMRGDLRKMLVKAERPLPVPDVRRE